MEGFTKTHRENAAVEIQVYLYRSEYLIVNFDLLKVKIASSIVCFFLLMFQSTGYYLYFRIQQQHIRHEIKQQIKAGVPEDEIVLLKLSRTIQDNWDEFQWIHDHEFRYQGKMYDIVRQEDHGETTWFYCIRDEKETLLFARLDEQVKNEMQNMPGNDRQRERLMQWYNTLFFSETNTLTCLDPWYMDCSTPFYFHYTEWESPPDTPPPVI